MLLTLEGGYDVAALANSVRAVLMEMKGMPVYMADEGGEVSVAGKQAVLAAKEAIKPYWKF